MGSSSKDRFLINYHHWIIEELTQGEIDLLQTKLELVISRENSDVNERSGYTVLWKTFTCHSMMVSLLVDPAAA
jgi:hypothetical protein